MTVINISKGTGTYADSLRAIGIADLLKELTGNETLIKDVGTHFQIEYDDKILPEKWKVPTPGFYYIWRKSKEKTKPQGALVLDYEAEQNRVKGQKKGSRKVKKEIEKVMQEQDLVSDEKINPEYRPSSILESMRKGWMSDKDVYIFVINNPDKALEWAKDELLNKGNKKAPFKVSSSQYYNPSAGKGVHSPKTISKSPGAINDKIIDPFSEWMKYRGAYLAMLPYRNGDDFKIFVIEPAEISPGALYVLRKNILNLNLWGGIRLDIEATLRLTEELINHSDVVQRELGKISLRGKRPNEIISGLRQAFFKSMGTAPALMNESFLPLPAWFQVSNIDDANIFLEIIREHIGYYESGNKKAGCLSSLDEKNSNDIPILQQYRKWLTTGNIFDLLNFLSIFAIHIIYRLGRNEWVKEFTVKNLTELFIRGYGMKEIVEDVGFLSVARGIRNCTIYAVSLKKREPHFGLAQKWKQKIKGGAKEFIPVLCDFVQTQNWEVEHKLHGKGHIISKEDIDRVITLIEKYGVELVGMLLLAYGYARAPKTEEEN